MTAEGGAFPPLRPAAITLRPDAEAVLAVRPTGVRITAVTDEGRHLSGRVTDVAFRGRGYEHAIDVPGHGQLTGVFAGTRAARGDQVGLRLEPAGCHLFPAAADPEPAPDSPEPASPEPASAP